MARKGYSVVPKVPALLKPNQAQMFHIKQICWIVRDCKTCTKDLKNKKKTQG